MKKSKRYRAAVEKIEKTKKYTPEEALEIINQLPPVKFDESVEVHLHLNIDPRKTDQHIRGFVSLPHGTGAKAQKIVAFTETQVDEAKKAGADIIGDEKLIEKIAKDKKIDFDVVVATPEMMPKLSKIAKILGPRGLMPNPKSGTVGTKIAEMIAEIKKGKAELKTDKGGNIHQIIGRRSFTPEKLLENFKVLVEAVQKNKPAKVKGQLMKSITISTTMGPGIKIKL